MLIKVARKALVPSLIALLIIGSVVPDHVSASIDDGITNGIIKRLGRLIAGDPNHFSFFYSLSAAEGKINQNIRVLF
jgi:hypothetical protein